MRANSFPLWEELARKNDAPAGVRESIRAFALLHSADFVPDEGTVCLLQQ
jgi:hypothetical protein